MVELEIGHKLYVVLMILVIGSIILGFLFLIEKFERLWIGIKIRLDSWVYHNLKEEKKEVIPFNKFIEGENEQKIKD